jgi:hypothetical protein
VADFEDCFRIERQKNYISINKKINVKGTSLSPMPPTLKSNFGQNVFSPEPKKYIQTPTEEKESMDLA